MKAIEYLKEKKKDCINSDNHLIADYCSAVFEVVYEAYYVISALSEDDLKTVELYREEMEKHSEYLSGLSN